MRRCENGSASCRLFCRAQIIVAMADIAATIVPSIVVTNARDGCPSVDLSHR